MKKKLHKFSVFLASPKLFFYVSWWLMALVVIGTLSQSTIGLYASQKIYFSSFFFTYFGVPLPGGYMVMTVIFIGLLCKLLFHTQWNNSKQWGTHIIHIGVVSLLLGGLLTSIFGEEGSLVLKEGETSNVVSHYYDSELVIARVASHKRQKVFKRAGKKKSSLDKSFTEHNEIVFHQKKLFSQEVLAHKQLPFAVNIIHFFKNCQIFKRAQPAEGIYRGFNKIFFIQKIASYKEAEKNIPCVEVVITKNSQSLGRYAVYKFMPISQTLTVNGEKFIMKIRNVETKLPFSIKLIDFTKKNYAKTNVASNYKSEVVLIDGAVTQRKVIQMNEPLRYKGYTFYQASFVQNNNRETSIFSVVKNIGWSLPYITSLIICLGMLIHLLIRIPSVIRRSKIKKTVHIAAILFILFSIPDLHSASKKFDMKYFKKWVILHEGRIKPLDSFARIHLLIFYGKSSLKDMSATEWMAEVLFSPVSASNIPSFQIKNIDLLDQLHLSKRKDKAYSFNDIGKAFQGQVKNIGHIFKLKKEMRTPLQKQLVSLYQKYLIYKDMAHSLSLVEPYFFVRSKTLSREMNLTLNKKYTYLEILHLKDFVVSKIKKIDSKNISKEEEWLALFGLELERMEGSGSFQIFKIIPPQWNYESQDWQAPWEIVHSGGGSPFSSKIFESLKTLTVAYRNGDVKHWNTVTQNIFKHTYSTFLSKKENFLIKLETMYNFFDPFTKALALYILSFIFLAFSWIFYREFFYKLSYIGVVLGFGIHFLGLVSRVTIMSRPPVTTLYESTLFVSCIAVLFSLIYEKILKNSLGVLIASILGTSILFVSMGYSSEGDSFGVLAAVLNTNFWLSTHVVSITIGYSCGFVGGVLGHVYFIKKFLGAKLQNLNQLYSHMQGISLFALFFSIFGTILGGIWADQSWGRFWGWDPKENGALLICLWLLMLLHGKLSGIIKSDGFALGMVVLNVIIALAWFGVNLLSVGLHSYGFTDNIAFNLFMFCFLELLFGLVFYFAHPLKRKS